VVAIEMKTLRRQCVSLGGDNHDTPSACPLIYPSSRAGDHAESARTSHVVLLGAPKRTSCSRGWMSAIGGEAGIERMKRDVR